jgi:hypothetical protein
VDLLTKAAIRDDQTVLAARPALIVVYFVIN